MAFNIPATPTYVGFWPVESAGTIVQCNPYLVSSSEGSDISIGDVLTLTTKNTARIPAAGTWQTMTSSQATLGVAASIVKAGDGSTGANVQVDSSRIVLVYDGANQVFAGCDTTSGVAGPLTGYFKNYGIETTGCVGSTGPVNGRSNMVISGVTATAAGIIKLIGLHPCERGVFTSGSAGGTVTSSGVRKHLFIFETGLTLQSTQLVAINNTTS